MTALIFFIGIVLYILKDIIADILSGGKPFAPNELKYFK